MYESLFTSKVQSIMYTLVFQMMEKLTEKQSSTSTSASVDGSDPNAGGGRTLTGASSNVTGDFASLINQAAEKYGVDAELVDAVIRAESNYDSDAVSSAGALGLMQLMPTTADWLGVDNPLDPAENIDGGVKFLSQLLDRYDGSVQLALAAYNAGPGAVDKYQGIPPYSETQTYVSRIMGYLGSNNDWSG